MKKNIEPAYDRISVLRTINMKDGPHKLRFTATATGEVSEAGMWRIRYDDTTYGTNSWQNPVEDGVAYIPDGGIRVCTDGVDEEDMPVFIAAAVNIIRWNGFASPWFTREEAQKIADHNKKLIDSGLYGADAVSAISYDADRDVFIDTYDFGDGPETEAWATADFSGQRLHSIGGGSWTWAEAAEYGF